MRKERRPYTAGNTTATSAARPGISGRPAVPGTGQDEGGDFVGGPAWHRTDLVPLVPEGQSLLSSLPIGRRRESVASFARFLQ